MEKKLSKILVIGILFLFLGASATLGSANLVWSDNFDSYTDGQLLDGTSDDGGWTGWANTPSAYGMVTDDQARSAPYSDQIWLNSDNVHEYSGYSSGIWDYTAWQYIPVDFSGITYFILLCGYDGGGSGTVWVVQLHFDSELDEVGSEFGGEVAPIVYGQWTEIRCHIDLDTDWLQIYYDGVLLAEHAYTDTVQGTGGGSLNIAAVDLFANGATPVYYDDISLLPPGAELVCDAGGPYTGEINQAIAFTGFASGGTTPYTWAWAFGDGGTATVQNPTHTYTTAGTYTATLTVTDAAAATVTDTATVTVTAPQPVLAIGAITGGFGIKSSVKNTGEGAATNVAWTITLDGKLVFVGKSSTGDFATIAPAGDEAIKAGFILGFGKTNIVVSATCDEGLTAEATASGFVLGPFILGVK
jgi:phage baseplate assembly protein gpV